MKMTVERKWEQNSNTRQKQSVSMSTHFTQHVLREEYWEKLKAEKPQNARQNMVYQDWVCQIDHKEKETLEKWNKSEKLKKKRKKIIKMRETFKNRPFYVHSFQFSRGAKEKTLLISVNLESDVVENCLVNGQSILICWYC